MRRAASAARRLADRVRPLGPAVLHRWRRSLQLRVATTVAVLTGLLALLLGVVLLHQISSGLLDDKKSAAEQDVRSRVDLAKSQLKIVDESNQDALSATVRRVLTQLSQQSSPAGVFDIAAVDRQGQVWSTTTSRTQVPRSIPADLRAIVQDNHPASAYGQIVNVDGSQTSGLILGTQVFAQQQPIELYYFFPLTSEGRALALVQRTVLLAGLSLMLLVAMMAVLVTRLVVGPVRLAAVTAHRLAEGRLEERMQVSGEDDLAVLARSFNEMADSLQRQITKLEEMSRLQRRFTSDVSHELRTPLTTVRMAADVLHAHRDEFPPEVARSTELLHAELGRFEALLADLLEISRYDAGVAALEAEPVDLGALVHRVTEATSALAARHGSRLRLNLPAEPAVAEVDPRRVERILRNLLGNALEHGEGRPVDVTLARGDAGVAITVRDRGVGLRPGEAGLVFDRFWRADPSRNRRTGGTGLGLAISLEDARLHGGWLHAWGQPGVGAQFRLTLPIRPGEWLTRSPLPVVPPDLPSPQRPPTVQARPLASARPPAERPTPEELSAP